MANLNLYGFGHIYVITSKLLLLLHCPNRCHIEESSLLRQRSPEHLQIPSSRSPKLRCPKYARTLLQPSTAAATDRSYSPHCNIVSEQQLHSSVPYSEPPTAPTSPQATQKRPRGHRLLSTQGSQLSRSSYLLLCSHAFHLCLPISANTQHTSPHPSSPHSSPQQFLPVLHLS